MTGQTHLLYSDLPKAPGLPQGLSTNRIIGKIYTTHKLIIHQRKWSAKSVYICIQINFTHYHPRFDLINKNPKGQKIHMKDMVRKRQQRQERQKRQKTRTTWLTFQLDFPGRLCNTAFTILAMFGYCHCGSLFGKFSFLTTFLWIAFLDNLQNVVVGHCSANLLLWINFCKIASSIYCVQIIVLQL